MRRRLVSVLLAFLMVTSAVTVSTGSVAAQTLDPNDCDGMVAFIKNAVSMGLTGTSSLGCSPENSKIQDMKDSDANQTKTDIYNAAVSETSSNDVFNAVYGNYLNDSESVAWMKMQVAVAEAYQNGSSQAEATAAAKQAIDDYYSVKQINLAENYAKTVSHWKYLHETAENESGIGSSYVISGWDGGSHTEKVGLWEQPSGETLNPGSNTTATLTLSNGSSYDLETIYFDHSNAGITAAVPSEPVDFSGEFDYYLKGLAVEPPTSDYEREVVLKQWEYRNKWTGIESKASALQTEAENFVSATYGDFDSGEANASDVISANTAMFEYGTSHDGNSSLYDSTAALSLMGFDTPNMSNSGTMDVSYSGNTYTGILLARNAPGGGWDTGTTYNTSNITGPVFLATTDGKKIDFADSTEFTVDRIRARDGTNVTRINTTEYVYKTANTSELVDMQNQLIDLRKEIESREPSSGGGGALGSSDTMIAIVALAGAALLLGRSNQ
jgi:hypothetical protein